MFGASFGLVVFHLEAARGQAVADDAGAVFVGLSRRIDGRDADQIRCEVDEFVGERVHGGEGTIDGGRRRHAHARITGML
jgi:hypothetical protein